ncbi:MAG: hypothetical protein MR224_05450 [Dorea sp.]|nr:hypothetical protein [Dorea sp.]MDY2812984.1 hypothetical protein [Dorea sp.]
MMMAYKAFHKDLTCTMGRGTFRYEEGKWFEEEEANCRKNGFHCAENPLDCLNYYGNMEESVYYIVLADGDINEDYGDSKISCTRIKLVKKLTIEEFVAHALKYMYEHPQMETGHVETDHGEARKDFVIVRGKNPIAKGAPGTVLGFVKEERNSRHVEELGVYTVGEQGIQPDTWYDINGKVAEV